MTDTLKVLTICGSLRKGSYNAALARMAPKLAPPSMTFTDAPSFASIPIFTAPIRRSEKTASSCAVTNSAGTT